MTMSSIGIALRGIVANKLRSALTTLGILIGVASVILVVAVGARVGRRRPGPISRHWARARSTVRAGGFGFGARAGTQSQRYSITDSDVNALRTRATHPTSPRSSRRST